MSGSRGLLLSGVASMLAALLVAADPPRVWADLESGNGDQVAAQATALIHDWSVTNDIAALRSYIELVGAIRAFPRATAQDRMLVEQLASGFLDLPAADKERSSGLITQQAALVDQLLSEDAWSVVQPLPQRRAMRIRLATLTVPVLRLIAAHWIPGWKPPRLHDPRAGVVFGDKPREIDPQAVAQYEKALAERSMQRAWNDAMMLIRISLGLAAHRAVGGNGQAEISAFLQSCGVERLEAETLADRFTETGSDKSNER